MGGGANKKEKTNPTTLRLASGFWPISSRAIPSCRVGTSRILVKHKVKASTRIFKHAPTTDPGNNNVVALQSFQALVSFLFSSFLSTV